MAPEQPVLLVGGNGFYGRALARRLATSGREVHVVSRSTEPGEKDGVSFHRGSQDDPAVMRPLLERCPVVVHLASTSTPGSSARDPVHDTTSNVLPAARMLDIAAQTSPDRILFVSSGGSVYGNPATVPVDETATLSPLSYHAAGKVALEALFQAFAHAHSTSLAVLRPSNLYGPGQDLRSGFGLVRTLLERALRDEPVEVWGDGSAVRDYIYIDDAVAACERLIGQQTATGVFNLGSGRGTSIAEMVELVALATGRQLEIVRRPGRATDVRAIVLDSERLRNVTGRTAHVGLAEGLERTWRWVSSTRYE
jgi:UDP-glucose 4-epimerase